MLLRVTGALDARAAPILSEAPHRLRLDGQGDADVRGVVLVPRGLRFLGGGCWSRPARDDPALEPTGLDRFLDLRSTLVGPGRAAARGEG
ncbi:hypothetical protein [Actinokineospora pegani]|uniref:hypothetical protein n=1 Tax=Actinokineospora pegani TaxID=2654637 RepID=UPI0012EA9DD8|nr:hypothetical protein [Actinokineospora pegani]